MADFAAVLRKAINALKENTPEAREKIYEKARVTIETKIASATPSLPSEQAERHRKLLEDAIATVEAEHAPRPSEDDDLASFLSQLDEVTWSPASEREDATVLSPLSSQDDGPSFQADTPEASEPLSEGEKILADDPIPASSQEAGSEEIHDESAEPVPGSEAESQYTDEAEAVTSEEQEEVEEPVEHAAPVDAAYPRARSRTSKLVAALLVFLLVGATGVGAWIYRDVLTQIDSVDDIGEMLADLSDDPALIEEDSAETSREAEPEEAAAQAPDAGSEQEGTRKFTQRLLPDGREVDAGPAADSEPTLGEGTSIAAADNEVPEEGQPAAESAIPVGQKAIFYEERTSTAEGSANDGSVVWSIVQESPGEGLPPEPVIRADATITGRDLQLKMTIRRNVDQSLPASHIIELIFLTPDNFSGGSIRNVARIAMKRNEQDAGSPLLGIPAKIADGFFLVALSDRQADLETNSTLMRRENWIDIPVIYTSGRRALITLEKGVPGERVFTEALDGWRDASSG